MKILTRYILREALTFFLIALFAFTGVLLTVRMLQFASLIINKGVSFGQIGDVFISIVPTFLEIAVPMAALLGVMLAFARLSGDSEIIVIRANGISLLQLMRPLIILGLFLASCSLYISVFLRPWGNAKLAQALFDIAHSRSTAGLYPGIFNKLGPLILYAEKIDDRTGHIERVLIDDKRDEASRKFVLAQTGTIASDPENRNIILKLHDGYIHEEVEKSYTITDFTTNNLVLNVDELYSTNESSREKKDRELSLPEIQESLLKFKAIVQVAKENDSDIKKLPEEMYNLLVRDDIQSYSELKRKVRRLQIEGGRRFSMPYATFILALIAMPLGILPPRTQRTWGAGLSIVLGLIVFMAYYMFLSLGITFAESGKIDPLLGLWLPNLITSLIAAYIIFKVGREQWPSIAHGFESVLEKIFGLVRRRIRT